MANGFTDTSTHTIGPINYESNGFLFVTLFQILFLDYDGILGIPWFREWNPMIDWDINIC